MKEKIRALLEDIVAHEQTNLLPGDIDGANGVPVPVFDMPLLAFGDAADPLFEELRRPGIVGEHAALPTDFMPEARTVIALFFPYSEPVRRSNRQGADPSMLWLHASRQSKTVAAAVYEKLVAGLAEMGIKGLDPTRGEEFKAVIGGGIGNGPVVGRGVAEDPLWAGKSYTCNWSERHVGYICGLGTFGISGGFITEKGAAGNLFTVIIDREVEPTARPYTDPFAYCIRCGACVRRCPGKALSLETGYSPKPCMEREDETLAMFAPLRGCGKCRVGVPCEFKNPAG